MWRGKAQFYVGSGGGPGTGGLTVFLEFVVLTGRCGRQRAGGGKTGPAETRKRGEKPGGGFGGLKPQRALTSPKPHGAGVQWPTYSKACTLAHFQPVTQMETEIYKRWATSSSDVAFHAVRFADRLS